LCRLEKEQLPERVAHGDEIRWRLSDAGKRRRVLFDVPETPRKQRDAFRWWLQVERLGQLQESVCVSVLRLNSRRFTPREFPFNSRKHCRMNHESRITNHARRFRVFRDCRG
jgi:hypothetical protein